VGGSTDRVDPILFVEFFIIAINQTAEQRIELH